VANVLKDSLDQRPQAELYVLAGGGATIRREINVVVRGDADPVASAQPLRQLVSKLRPDAPIDNVVPLADQVSDSVAQPRFAATVLGAFAGLALLLAAVGLYGVLSYMVVRRRREIGVRSALGASRGRLVRMVLREGLSVAVVGLIIGMASAAALTRLMQTLLVGIQPLDPISFAAAPMTLVVVALISCAIPARRAAATEPRAGAPPGIATGRPGRSGRGNREIKRSGRGQQGDQEVGGEDNREIKRSGRGQQGDQEVGERTTGRSRGRGEDNREIKRSERRQQGDQEVGRAQQGDREIRERGP
jgi:FtsX-like permease family